MFMGVLKEIVGISCKDKLIAITKIEKFIVFVDFKFEMWLCFKSIILI